jgi:tetratricopeptide (TPR) repeat protein
LSKVTQIRQKARIFLQKGKFDKAIEEYKRLTGMETKNPNHLNELGDIYLKAGDSIQAVSNFERAIVNYEKVALYNNAVAVCKKILRIIPGRIETIYKMGELRAKQKLEGEARICFSQYLDSILADAESYGPELNEKLLIMLELVPECEEIIIKAAAIFKLIGIKTGAFELYSKLAADAEREGETEKYQGYIQEVEGLRSSMTQDEIKGVEDSVERGMDKETAAEGEGPAGEPSEDDTTADDGAAPGQESAADKSTADQAEPVDEAEKSVVEDYEIPPMDDDEALAEAEAPVAEEPAAGEEAQVTEEKPETGQAEPAQDEIASESADDGEPAVEAAPEQAPASEDETEDDGTGEKGVGFDDIIEDDSSSGETENLVEEITSDVEEDDYQSHYDLGMAYLEMALFTEAIKEFQIASRSDQLQVKSIEMIGHCFLQQGNPRLAVKQLNRGLDLHRRYLVPGCRGKDEKIQFGLLKRVHE